MTKGIIEVVKTTVASALVLYVIFLFLAFVWGFITDPIRMSANGECRRLCWGSGSIDWKLQRYCHWEKEEQGVTVPLEEIVREGWYGDCSMPSSY